MIGSVNPGFPSLFVPQGAGAGNLAGSITSQHGSICTAPSYNILRAAGSITADLTAADNIGQVVAGISAATSRPATASPA